MSTDTGEADARLAAALLRYVDDVGARPDVVAALVDARVFAAITATASSEHVEVGTGLRAESSAEMAVVLLEAPDGTRALPVFSDLGAMKRWRLDARPVPLTGAQACQAALDEGATAVVLDQAVTLVELDDLARGFVPVAGTGLSTRREDIALSAASGVDPALRAALAGALAGEDLRSARLLQGPDGLVLGVAPRSAVAPAELAALAHRVMARLGPALPADGLDLAQVAPKGPGEELLKRRPFRLRPLR